ncbi:cation/calcium exchanger 1-like [Typha latifolia]|uniref:cation/calcium exchanger 1-like n=1 Tax=Typha latifolia TaxID=4733 RepID=UPI003C2FF3E3
MAFLTSFNKLTALITFSFFLLFFFSFFLVNHLNPSPPRLSTPPRTEQDDCQELEGLKDHNTKCAYLKSHIPCVPQGYIDYLQVFYCTCGQYPLLGYLLFALWLVILFYLLGNTTSQYFCSSLESLSNLLMLPPTIAGVTLLSLGNGAPDVFSSVVSFAGAGVGVGEVGLSSIMGGALFVSTVVVGLISLLVSSRCVAIDQKSFVRDLCFLILVLCSLLAMMVFGTITLWGSISFFSLYIAYIVLVWTSHYCGQRNLEELEVPLLKESEVEDLESNNLVIVTYYKSSVSSWSYYSSWFFYLIEMPLYLPRRLTIPDVSEERWSKPFAVASAAFSPVLLAAIWNSQSDQMSSEEKLTVYLVGSLVGIVLGLVALETTEKAHPPEKCLFPWLAGGFLMSMIWTYMIARELVSLLVSVGRIVGISPAILGLSVLAWGNSLGDLIANIAMAVHGGIDGVQIAISGCYAGPIFNTVVGLGLSLVLASWNVHPSPFVIPQDSSLFQTLGFLIGGLLWALFILPRREMKLDRVLGVGLLALYLCFLSLRLTESLGLVQFGASPNANS